MSNIEQYRKRFYGLMESTMGDVKPLINEEITPEGLYFIAGPFKSKTEDVWYKVYCNTGHDANDYQWKENDCFLYQSDKEFGEYTKSDKFTGRTQKQAMDKMDELVL
jgi:hypothetical protein